MRVTPALIFIAVVAIQAATTGAPPAFDAGAINSTNQPETLRGAKGSAVVRAQILLGRAHFSCGEIDGSFGTNLSKTLVAFQESRGLPASRKLDSATWYTLHADNAPALISYTTTAEDAAGPFV